MAYRDLYANAANPILQNLVPIVAVAEGFRNSGAGTMADFGGRRVFVRPEYFEYSGNGYAATVIMHELLDNLTGLTDPDLQRNRGLPESGASNNITLKLLQDCLAQ